MGRGPRRWLWLASSTAASLLGVLSCGDDSASDSAGSTASAATGSVATGVTSGGPSSGASSTSGAGGSGGSPRIGAHGLSYYGYGENDLATIDSPALATKPAGSTVIVSTGRGSFPAFALPTDDMGNRPYSQLGEAHTYTLWQGSGTALYGFEGAVGGPHHVITNTTAPGDEITLAAVEVTDATHIVGYQWIERLSGESITSAPVTTTGPATLVAFWWGDAGVDGDKVAVPNNGFAVLDSVGHAGALVQCFVAAKEVDAAGTYDVTWDATPPQGAQLWIVAVQ